MNRLHAAAIALPLAIAGCALPGGGAVIPPITEPPAVQQACTWIALAVPIAEQFRSRMTAPQQALLTSAEAAVQDCAAGNATMAVLDLATALEAYLTGQGVPKAQVMRRAMMR